jgi:hypothetical protein
MASRISFTQLIMRLGNLQNSRRASIPEIVSLPHMPDSEFLDAKHILDGTLHKCADLRPSDFKNRFDMEKESAVVPESRVAGHPCNLLRPACMSAAADSLPR